MENRQLLLSSLRPLWCSQMAVFLQHSSTELPNMTGTNTVCAGLEPERCEWLLMELKKFGEEGHRILWTENLYFTCFQLEFKDANNAIPHSFSPHLRKRQRKALTLSYQITSKGATTGKTDLEPCTDIAGLE